MLGVSFDMDKKEWQDAIKRDTLNWEQVCDFGGLNSEVAKQYAIKQVPSNILLSADGKILAKNLKGEQLKKILDHSLRPVGMILLVIASGGVIRWMLQDSGLGTIIGPALEKSGLPLILIAFLIALLVRASVGSSIVAMTMASGVMATMPAVMATSMLYRAAMCCAICGGATALSHVNDAGFWLVGTFLEIDEKTTLKSWTIMETLIGITSLIVALIVSIFA